MNSRKIKSTRIKSGEKPAWTAKCSLYIFYGLLAYMPLHIFISTWLGTSFDVLVFAKILKDIVAVLGFLLALVAASKEPWLRGFAKSKFVWAILLYTLWTLILVIFRQTDQDAEILGVVFNIRFLMFFLYGLILARLFNVNEIRRQAVKIVVVVGAIVVSFGILQYAVLPDDALTHLGYRRANGVLPAFFIDDKPDLERVMSTIRDPNSLGSYLIILAPLVTAGLFIMKYARDRWPPALMLAAIILCTFLTFSRGAWIGLVATMITFFFLTDSPLKIEMLKRRHVIIPAFLGTLVVLAGLLFAFRNTYIVQNVVLHADESTVLEDPNEIRVREWGESVDNISENPIGHGPGTAGLASIRNDLQGTELNENYYFQIAYETGLIGLGLFLAILLATGRRLFDMRHDSYVATALLAAFVGLAITNFLVHIWSNEAVAYTWWGLAALTIASRRKV